VDHVLEQGLPLYRFCRGQRGDRVEDQLAAHAL
jgi:hypothetical protein